MSGRSQHEVVKSIDHPIDVDELMRKIERYIAVVAVFRTAGCDVCGIGRRERSTR